MTNQVRDDVWMNSDSGDRPFRAVYESAVPRPGQGPMDGWLPEPQLQINGLGPGWEQVEDALAAVQADLSRTVDEAPQLMLLWYDREDGQRHAYVGKAADWYFGSNGGFELGRHYVEALVDIADEVREAINDSLLGDRWDWPLCPQDGWTLSVAVDGYQTCSWVCSQGGHDLGEVGRLGLE
jgi:hypothetical protein